VGRKFKNKEKEHGLVARLRESVLSFLRQHPGKAYSQKQIAHKLGFKKRSDLHDLGLLLDTMAEDGLILFSSSDGYSVGRKSGALTGIVDHVNPRFAYVMIGEGQKDFYVRARDLASAFHGDTVKVAPTGGWSGENPEGRVTEIVRRARTTFVGRVELSKNFAFVVPDFRKIYQDFYVYPEHLKGAKTNDKVVLEVTEWPRGDRNPQAKVVEILGKAGENEAEIHSIMAEFGLPFRFPENVQREASRIEEGITKEEIRKRQDFRDVLTFTIDPADAKDFDDAISFREISEGIYEVGVHIADVTHYVKHGTLLEEEAFDRATSVYLVDRTVPMLPERLSNELCSLRPKEDKLTFAAVFHIDRKTSITKEWYGRTVIHSDHRFTYEEAQAVIESGKGLYAKELVLLNDLAKKLRRERFRKGAVNFETTEVKFRLDEKGRPLEVVPKVRKDAHKLIEEFMLLANKGVATFVYNRLKGREKNTFVYRIHDFPDPDKVEDFATFSRQFGHKLQTDEGSIARSLNKLMEEIEGKPEQNVLQSLAVRAMAKAKYSTETKGHFGLAFQHYSHFTSPIRRYPDMMAHRLVQHYLDGGKPPGHKEYEERCIHSSEREKRAADAERASIKYKQVEFMSLQEDKPYDGLITGVTDFGIFVEIIETKCEGMVRLADMKDDFYEYDERNYRVVGRRRKKVYRLGDEVTVRVKKTDIDRRLMDLVFVGE
jgi:ribonuclease R